MNNIHNFKRSRNYCILKIIHILPLTLNKTPYIRLHLYFQFPFKRSTLWSAILSISCRLRFTESSCFIVSHLNTRLLVVFLDAAADGPTFKWHGSKLDGLISVFRYCLTRVPAMAFFMLKYCIVELCGLKQKEKERRLGGEAINSRRICTKFLEDWNYCWLIRQTRSTKFRFKTTKTRQSVHQMFLQSSTIWSLDRKKSI